MASQARLNGDPTKRDGKGKISGIRDGWFSETEPMYPGQKFSLALEEFSEDKSVLYYGQSEFQSILVFRSAQYGNVLVLDGVIQLTERDEFCYHEMMVHVPLFSHPNPKRVLIVGGGDGVVLREVCRHDSVQSITICEIDKQVIEVAKQFFGNTVAGAFEDDRVEIVYNDAAQFLRSRVENDYYDVILADTSDPVGPAETLFSPSFYECMYSALADGGIVCAQGECMWIHLDYICDVVACCADMFDYAEYYSTLAPTFPCGQIGFVLTTKGRVGSCQVPRRLPSRDFMSKMRYYSPAVHSAAFVLPEFVKKRLEPLQRGQEDDNGDQCLLQGCVIS